MKYIKSIYIILSFCIGIIALHSCSSDDDCLQQSWYQDADGDGFGNPTISQMTCEQPMDYVKDSSDFDDTNATAFPGADEICDDGIDNDGNNEIDECLLSQVSGNWTTNFGSSYIINESIIRDVTNNYTFHILVSGSNFVICQNDETNPFDANLFSKFVFTNISTGNFNFCVPFFDSPTQASIESSMDPTDTNDLEYGCGGFAWGVMTRD